MESTRHDGVVRPEAPVPVVLDCDPGHDDVLAIVTAAHDTELVGITTVAGNAALVHTTRNALATVELMGIDVPVHSGAAGPLVGDARHATHVHGDEGLEGVDVPEPHRAIAGDDAAGFIVETARATPGLWIVAVGPLTNVAVALQRAPALATELAGISIMGGGTFGNATAGRRVQHLGRPRGGRRRVPQRRTLAHVRPRPHAPGVRRRRVHHVVGADRLTRRQLRCGPSRPLPAAHSGAHGRGPLPRCTTRARYSQ